LQNRHKHYILIENIWKEIRRLEDLRWTVFFNWVKAHVGIKGNEMADRLAKKAATEDMGEIVYDKIPRDSNYRREGERINKMAGAVDKLYKRSSQ
jgi:ribonuclease HI